MNHKAVFLDKDGTLVENIPYNVDPTQIRLVDGAIDGVRRLHAAGYRIFIVSNQSGIARGLFPAEAMLGVQACLDSLLADAQVPLAGFYYCPHHPEGRLPEYTIECFCRKPRPGMLFQAARDHGINLADSWMVGDILDDIEAGRRAGCNTVLIENGGETMWEMSPLRQPNRRAKTITEAVAAILEAASAELRSHSSTDLRGRPAQSQPPALG